MFDTAHIHPMLVHFPIALTLLGCLLESISLYTRRKLFACNCGELLLYFGTVAAILAATAGSLFTPDFTQHTLTDAKNIHSTVAGITVTMLCLASISYIAMHFIKQHQTLLRLTGYLFYVLAAFSVGATGYLGGVLVYNDLLKL